MNIVAGTIFTSIKSATQKGTSENDDVTDDNQDLNSTEWETFKEASNEKILDNYKRIGEFIIKMNESNNTFDGKYRTRIEKLESKNTELKSKLDNYDGNETQWKTFKSNFDCEMNEVGNSIKHFI